MTREEWMNAVAREMAPRFREIGTPVPEKVRITLSKMRNKAIGQCYSDTASKDGTFEILVRLDQDEPLGVAAIIAHELTHAAVGLGVKHSSPFKRVVRQLGLEGKATATVPGPAFESFVAPILESVGPFPHAALNFSSALTSGPAKQTTRMIKVGCSRCGFTVRQTRKWIDDVGPAHCPEHGEMEVEGQ